MNDRLFAHHAVVADDHPLKDSRLGLDAALAGDDGPLYLGCLADVAVAPHDAAIEARSIVNDGIVAHYCGAVDDHPALDLNFVAQVDGAIQLRVWRNLHTLASPNAAADMLT